MNPEKIKTLKEGSKRGYGALTGKDKSNKWFR